MNSLVLGMSGQDNIIILSTYLSIVQAKKGLKKDKNQLFETAVKQPPGGYTNSTKYEKAPQDFE